MNRGSRQGFFKKYRDAILFNKNLIISAGAGFLASALASQLYFQHDRSEFANSIVALAAEYATYLPLFAALFYVDNRRRYVDPATGRRDRRRIMGDIKKLFAAFSTAEVIYSITRLLVQYQLLVAVSGIRPYEASMASSLVAWVVFFVAINLVAKAVKLFKAGGG